MFAEGVHYIEIKNQSYDGSFSLVGRIGELKPGASKTIWLERSTEIRREPFLRVDDRGSLASALGTNREPWKLSLFFSKSDWRLKLILNPPRVLRTVLQFVPTKWLEWHPLEVHSDWIDGPELMPVAIHTADTLPK